MKQLLEKSWPMLALRGIIAIAFGILALLWPGLTLLWLVALFAAYAMLGGAMSVITAIKNRNADTRWWWILLIGLISVAAGIGALFYPGITAFTLVIVMGVNALFTGALEIGVAIRLRRAIRNEWLLILDGVLSLLFGGFVIAFPGAGALALVWLISFYALLSGVLLLSLAFRARQWLKNDTQMGIPHTA